MATNFRNWLNKSNLSFQVQPKQGYCKINEKEITGSNKPKLNEIVGKVKFNVNHVSFIMMWSLVLEFCQWQFQYKTESADIWQDGWGTHTQVSTLICRLQVMNQIKLTSFFVVQKKSVGTTFHVASHFFPSAYGGQFFLRVTGFFFLKCVFFTFFFKFRYLQWKKKDMMKKVEKHVITKRFLGTNHRSSFSLTQHNSC